MAAYAGTALIPYAGVPAMLAVKEHTAYKNLRDNAIRTGSSELDASLFADKWKTETAIPQTALEMLQTYIPLGKIPAVNRVLTSAGDRITNKFVRGALTAGAVNVGETVAEEAEHLTPFVVQDLAHAFAADTGISSAEWHNGKDGALDGIWTRAGVNFIAMGPLSAASIPGVLGRDERMRAFAEATPTQRLAFGLTAEDSAAIDAAALRGPSSLSAAVDTALKNRDPNSESAAAAVEELERQHADRQEAVRQAHENGILPKAVQSSDGGFTLYDTTTGEEIATAPDWESATRVATTHANMVEERDSDRIAAVASAYQGAQFSGDWSALTKQQTETRLDLGTSETTTHAAARSEDHRQRVESQELLDGGDGSVTRAVLGKSRTTFEQGQARTVNRILDGGSILTIFHEEAHGFRRRAHKNGSLTVADDIAILRAVDTVLTGKTTREGNKQLRLLPDNFDSLSPKDQETAIDEGISRLMEAEVLRTRKGGGVRELPPGVITKNLSALSRLAGDKSVGKFRSFIRAVRAHFGLAIDRATEIRRGLEDGSINPADYHDYLSKLHGIDARQILDEETSNGTQLDTGSLLSANAFSVGDPSRLSRPVAALEISGDILPGNSADWKNTVRQMIAEQLQRRSLDNRDTGQNIFFNSESRSQSVSKIRTEPAHRAALSIPSIVEEAIYIGHSPENKGKGDHVAGFDYFAIPLNLGGSERIAWFNTKKRSAETANKGQFYQFGLLEKEAARTSQSLAEEPRVTLPEGEYSNAGPARTVASFVDEVKGLLPSASSFVDNPHSFSLGPADPRLSERQSQEVEDLAFENAKRTRIVNTDEISPLIPGYSEANPLTRHGAFHTTANDITSRILARMLAEPRVSGKVLVIAGGNGSGKSIALGAFPQEFDLILDTTFSDPEHTNKLTEQIHSSGRQMEILYIHRQFGKAVKNIIARYIQGKVRGNSRVVPLAEAAATHVGAQENILNIKNTSITIFDNNRSIEEIHEIPLGHLAQQRYTNTHETREDEAGHRPKGIAGDSRKSRTGTNRARKDHGRSQAEARLEAEGRAIVERYRSDGFLTNAEARAFGGGRDVAIDYLPASGTAVDRGDPQGEIARLRGKQEHDAGRSAGTDEAQRSRNEAESLVSWAGENGRLIDAGKWEERLKSLPLLASGSEHHVYRDLNSGRVIKITIPPSYGAFGRSDAYLRILELHNKYFGDDVRLEGILNMGEGRHAVPAIVTSQPFTGGTSPTQEEISGWMSAQGFESRGNNVYINSTLGIKVMDAHTGNIIKTRTGTLIPIDLLIHELGR